MKSLTSTFISPKNLASIGCISESVGLRLNTVSTIDIWITLNNGNKVTPPLPRVLLQIDIFNTLFLFSHVTKNAKTSVLPMTPTSKNTKITYMALLLKMVQYGGLAR